MSSSLTSCSLALTLRLLSDCWRRSTSSCLIGKGARGGDSPCGVECKGGEYAKWDGVRLVEAGREELKDAASDEESDGDESEEDSGEDAAAECMAARWGR